MKIFRSFLAVAMLLVCTQAMADNYAYLNISGDDGQSSVQVSDISKITFDSDNMVIHLTTGGQQLLPLANLSKMFFSENGSQGLASITADRGKIKMDGSTLRLQLNEGERAVIYNMKGEQIFTANHSVEFQTGNLRRGVYIVRVGNESKKIMTR